MSNADSARPAESSSPAATPAPSRAAASPAPAPPAPPRVAIVAVHGVADQLPNESVRAIADLLASVDGAMDRQPRYRILAEETLRVPVRPMWERRESHHGELPRPRARSSAQRAMQSAANFAYAPVAAVLGTLNRSNRVNEERQRHAEVPEGLDFELMDDQLAEYQSPGPSATYETLRVSAMRDADDARAAPSRVDVYEMYWADLSRVRKGFYRIFAEVYQLFLHLGNLGAHLVDHEDITRGGRGGWRMFSTMQALTVGLLTLVLPVLNLVMLGTVLLIPILSVREHLLPVLLAAAAGIGAAAALDAMRARRAPSSNPVYLLPALVAGALAGWLAYTVVSRDPGGSFGRYHVLAAGWFACAGVGGARLMGVFDQHQPGVRQVAKATGLLWIVVLAWTLWHEPVLDTRAGLTVLAIRLMEPFYLVNALFWLVFVTLILVTCALGWVIARRDGRDRDAALRTAGTARVTLSLPAIGFLVMTLLLWIGLYYVFKRFVPGDQLYGPSLLVSGGDQIRLDDYFHGLLSASLTSGIAPALIVIAAAGAIMLWSLLPVVWSEVRPPRRGATAAADDSLSNRMGRRLSQAYRSAAISGVLLLVALLAFLVGGIWDVARALAELNGSPDTGLYASLVPWMERLGFRARFADGIVVRLGAVLGVSAVSLIALRGRLNVLAVGLRPVLDIALDVDNYLRHHPTDRTPRARIAERFTSLLDYLFEPRHPETPAARYDAIVLVAHSQGTVITADLLRYVRNRDLLAANMGYRYAAGTQEWSPPTPLFLFTMGSPLRQLYRLRFPSLYNWMGPARAETRSSLPADARPDPGELGVVRWVNAYRSGDYVGRNLWFDDVRCKGVYRRVAEDDDQGLRRRRTDRDRPSAAHPELQVAEDEDRRRREACIGPGAHTHYWDDTAPDVAALLDDLVAEALQGGAPLDPAVSTPRNWSYLPVRRPPAERAVSVEPRVQALGRLT